MHIHHLNCISTCPLGGKLMDGGNEAVWRRAMLCCHCLVVEAADGLVLIDTGLGLQDVRRPKDRLSRFFLSLLAPDLREEMTAVRQLQRLGYDARDVRHIVLTHLDFDHAGGLDDFPEATIHMMRSERDHAVAQESWLDRQRYRPAQWSSQRRWRTYNVSNTDTASCWYGFERVMALHDLPPEIVMVPLIGHTMGHAGIAVDQGDHWLLLAGDAYFYHEEMDLEAPRCTPGLAAYQLMMDKDRKLRIGNQQRLRELKRAHGEKVQIFCAHDPTEFEQMAGRPLDVPIGTIPELWRDVAS